MHIIKYMDFIMFFYLHNTFYRSSNILKPSLGKDNFRYTCMDVYSKSGNFYVIKLS